MSDLAAQWPKKRMAAGALFWDSESRFMLLKPTYKSDWEMPGGVVEDNESPYDGAMREVKEELSLNTTLGRLLCVDYGSAEGAIEERLHFIFDGGTLSAAQVASIILQQSEILEYRFVNLEEALTLVSDRKKKRLPACLRARNEKATFFLRDGQIVA